MKALRQRVRSFGVITIVTLVLCSCTSRSPTDPFKLLKTNSQISGRLSVKTKVFRNSVGDMLIFLRGRETYIVVPFARWYALFTKDNFRLQGDVVIELKPPPRTIVIPGALPYEGKKFLEITRSSIEFESADAELIHIEFLEDEVIGHAD